MGNIIELCARELYPDPKINLGFIMCLTRDYENIPGRALVEDCALEHAIDIKAINDCATRDDGAHGIELLRNSVVETAEVRKAHNIGCSLATLCHSMIKAFSKDMPWLLTRAQANVTISCTIRLNDDVYCVRDGGEWKDCPNGPGVNDLLVAIERLRHSS